MVPAHLHDEGAGMIACLRAGETFHNYETMRLHKSGRLISVVVTASPVLDTSGKIIGIAGISRDVSESKRLQAEIVKQREDLAVFQERERIAQELHDGLAQVLGYVNTKAQAVRRFMSVGRTAEADQHLLQLEQAARRVYADVRETILGLRSPVSQQAGLRHTLEDYLQNFEQETSVQSTLNVSDGQVLRQLRLPVEVQLIRIVQEALTNIRKHANATRVFVRVERVHNNVRIAIEDDGCGFNPDEIQRGDWPHFGLQIMRERAEGVGGNTRFLSNPDGGTCVCLVLPLRLDLEEVPL